MGVVWRATDQLLDRDVAVKEVRLNEALGEAERANAYRRTLREARTAARLSHRGVVTIFDVADEGGRPWIIMELIRSRSLDDVLASDGPLPPRRAARVAQQLLSALAHAHTAGVLHRDVKPSNVLISTPESDERAVLTDFGIAQFEGDPRLTQTGMVMGSPGFTAPERIRGGAATPASDLWSLGATIYAACEGRGPYEDRGGAITTMSAIINEDAPVAPSADRLGPIIASLLRRDPARRPTASTATMMIAEVLAVLPDKRRGRSATMLSRSSAGRAAKPVPPPPPRLAAKSADVAPTGVDSPRVAQRASAPPLSAPPVSAPRAEVPDDEKATPAASATPAAGDATDREKTVETKVLEAKAAKADAENAEAGEVSDAGAEPAAPEASPDVDAEDSAEDPATDAADAGTAKDAARPESDAPGAAEAGDAEAGATEDSAEDPATGADAADDDAQAAPVAVEAVAADAPIDVEAAVGGKVPVDGKTVVDGKTLVDGKTVVDGKVSLLSKSPVASKASIAAKAPAAGKAPVASKASVEAPDGEESPTIVAPAKADQPVPVAVPVAAQAAASAGPAASAGGPQAPVAPRPSRPVPPEKDPWWSTAYAQPGAAPRREAAPHREAVPYREQETKPSGTGTAAQPSFPYEQYPPGTGGRAPGSAGQRSGGGRGARKVLLAVAAVVVIAAAVVAIILAMRHSPTSQAGRTGTGTPTPTASTGAIPALTKDSPNVILTFDKPSSTLPTGFTAEPMAASQTGTEAGFSMAMPPGWQVQQQGKQVFFKAPDGVSYVEVDLTAQGTSDMVAALQSIRQQAMTQDRFPGYKLLDFSAQDVRNTRGALWRFDWQNSSGVTMRVDDMLFTLQTANGPQTYAIYMTAPEGNGTGKWNGTDGLLATDIDPMLQSFRPTT